jgi:hypothetical protein
MVKKNPQLLEIDIMGNPELMEVDLLENPDLMIVDPAKEDKAAVWRKLRKYYPPEIAAASFSKIYPDSKVNVKRNRGKKGGGPNPRDPKYVAAKKLFREFHGVDPEEVYEIEVPQLGEEGEDLYFVILGKAPADSYESDGVIDGSKKGGTIYVHPFEGNTYRAVSHDGQLLIAIGDYKVERKPGDDQAWIHH